MKKILIVIDMQNDFVHGCLGSHEARATIEPIIEKIRNHDGDVIFTQDTHFEDYLATHEGRYLPVPHCEQGTEGWEIIPELKPYAIDCVEKLTFGYVNWDSLYRWDQFKDATEIELCGVCTDICVISNALILRALYPEINIKVDAKCCAGVTPEKHKAALEVMKSCHIDVYGEEN